MMLLSISWLLERVFDTISFISKLAVMQRPFCEAVKGSWRILLLADIAYIFTLLSTDSEGSTLTNGAVSSLFLSDVRIFTRTHLIHMFVFTSLVFSAS
jgi:hypothetical protein